MFIRIFNTPEAQRANLPFEQHRVVEESSIGVLVQLGQGHYGMLPWEYVARYGYQLIR